MKRKIYDIGMNNAQDTSYYLWQGHDVVAIDADPVLIEKANERFANEIKNARLNTVNCAISYEDNSEIDFYISEKDEWNSLKKEIAERKSQFKKVVKVKIRRLDSLIREFGMPDYIKIDIEGYDIVALKTLEGISKIPKYISCETECAANEILSEEQALETLNQMKQLGYIKFKLVDQSSLSVLSPTVKFYGTKNIINKIFTRLLKLILPNEEIGLRKKAILKAGYPFPPTASGFWGEELEGEWMDFETARNSLLKHRRDYFNLPSSVSYGFWCDWHATY